MLGEADVPEAELVRSATGGITTTQIKEAVERQKTLVMSAAEQRQQEDVEPKVEISAAELKRLRELASKFEELSSSASAPVKRAKSGASK